MSDEPQCWAFSPHGERCELQAGHDGLHTISVVWSDESSWKPGQAARPTVTTTGGRDVPIFNIVSDGKCVACGHSHPPVDGEPVKCACGCYAQI